MASRKPNRWFVKVIVVMIGLALVGGRPLALWRPQGQSMAKVVYVQSVTGKVFDENRKPLRIRQRVVSATVTLAEAARIVLVSLKDGKRSRITGPATVRCSSAGWTVSGGSSERLKPIETGLLKHVGTVIPNVTRSLGEIVRDPSFPLDIASVRPYGAVLDLTSLMIPGLKTGDRCSIRIYQQGNVLTEVAMVPGETRARVTAEKLPLGANLIWSLTLIRDERTYDREIPFRILSKPESAVVRQVSGSIPMNQIVQQEADPGLALVLLETYVSYGMAGDALDLLRVLERLHPDFGLATELKDLEDQLRGQK